MEGRVVANQSNPWPSCQHHRRQATLIFPKDVAPERTELALG